jgi:glycosyltransferase involved in cell wall biosynthesis
VGRAEPLLGVDAGRFAVISNGFDPEAFTPHEVEREPFWRRHLTDVPRGWAPGGGPGSVRYDDLDAFSDAAGPTPVLLYSGRFTEVKRVPLLIEAHARAADRSRRRVPLVLLGGFPGEWEGEHPLDAVRRTGAPDVFLAGWHEHEELPGFLAASDVIVRPSVREQFGQVLVEGMACGLPAIAVDAHGPGEIVKAGATGWLVKGDDLEGLTDALVDAVNDPEERRRRGAAAVADVQARFAWPALSAKVAALYDDVTNRRPFATSLQ